MRSRTMFALCLLATGVAPVVYGQLGTATSIGGGSSFGGSSGGGSSGMFGARNLGGTIGSSGFGSGGAGGMSGMNSGAGSSAFGSSNQFGGSSFLSNARQAGSFVGTTAASAQAMQQQIGGSMQGNYRNGQYGGTSGMYGSSMTGMRGMTGMTGMSSMYGSRGMNSGRGMMGGGNTLPSPVRVAKQVGFDYPLPAAAQAGAALSQRLNTAPTLKVRGVTATVQGQTAILRGSVASSHDRQVAEQLALLEPGIWQVQNELVVAQPAATPSDNRPQLLDPPLPTSGPQLSAPQDSK